MVDDSKLVKTNNREGTDRLNVRITTKPLNMKTSERAGKQANKKAIHILKSTNQRTKE